MSRTALARAERRLAEMQAVVDLYKEKYAAIRLVMRAGDHDDVSELVAKAISERDGAIKTAREYQQIAADVPGLKADLARAMESLNTARAQHQAVRDASHELQRRNREASTLLHEANVLLADLAAEAPPQLRVLVPALQDTHDLSSRLPIDPRERITVSALLDLRKWQARLSELAATGDVDRIPF